MTYKIKCLGEMEGNSEEQCGEPYHGETDRNGYTRGCEHQADLNNRRENSALWKHCVEKHGSVEQKFEMVIMDRARNDATKRQILEDVRIQRSDAGRIMNGRGEWNSNRVPRINANGM